MSEPHHEPNPYAAPSGPNPYAAPTGPGAALNADQLYAQKPLYRRNGPLSALLLLGLLTSVLFPMFASAAGPAVVTIAGVLGGSPILVVCGIVLTGPVYNKALAGPGQLTTWGAGNKVVAVLIVAGWAYSLVARFS